MLQYICIYIIYWKTHSSANCLYLIIMGPLSMENTQQCKLPLSNNYGTIIYGKQTAVQPVWTGKFALHTKNRAIKRGLGRKNRAGKKSRRIRDEKRAMCEWDHWNSIGAIPTRYRGEFVTSKTPQIRAVCVMSLTVIVQVGCLWMGGWVCLLGCVLAIFCSHLDCL